MIFLLNMLGGFVGSCWVIPASSFLYSEGATETPSEIFSFSFCTHNTALLLSAIMQPPPEVYYFKT